MSPQLEWNEFLDLYGQINNSPSISPTPRPILGFEQYLSSPEKIRETCNPRRTSPSRHDTYRGRVTSSSPSITYSYSRSGSTHTYVPAHLGRDRSYSPSSPSSSSSSSSRSGSKNSYVPASRGRDRSYSPSTSSSSSRSSSKSEGSNTYGYIPPPQPDRQGSFVYLPLRDALRILSDVQSTMEEACYSFAEQHFPQVLEKKGWDCPQAVELNAWAAVFFERRNFKLLCNFSQFTGNTRDLGELLDSMKQIRHAAVHRHRLTVTTIEAMVEDAFAFCQIVGDEACNKDLHAIWGAASRQISQLYKSQPFPPPEPSTTLQIPSPKLLPVSQREISTGEQSDRRTEADTESDVDDRTNTTVSKEHFFWSRRTWQ